MKGESYSKYDAYNYFFIISCDEHSIDSIDS